MALTVLLINLAILSKNCFQAETSSLVVSSASLIFLINKTRPATKAITATNRSPLGLDIHAAVFFRTSSVLASVAPVNFLYSGMKTRVANPVFIMVVASLVIASL